MKKRSKLFLMFNCLSLLSQVALFHPSNAFADSLQDEKVAKQIAALPEVKGLDTKITSADVAKITETAEIKAAKEQQEALLLYHKGDPASRVLPDWIHIEISQKLSADTFNPEAISMLRSYVKLSLGDDMTKYLNNVKEVRENAVAVNFTVRISAIPELLGSTVLGQVEDKINAAAATTRQQYLAAAAGQIQQQVHALVISEQLPAAMAPAVEAKYFAAARTTIDAGIQKAVQAKTQEARNRMNDIQTELIYQEVSFMVAGRIFQNADLAVVGYAQVGKNNVNGNFGPTTGIADLSPTYMFSTSSFSTQATGMVRTGIQVMTNDKQIINLEANVFHNRVPLIDANMGLSAMMGQSAAAWENQQDITRLDSNNIKATYKRPALVGGQGQDQIYVETTDIKNPKTTENQRGFGFGVLAHLGAPVMIQIEGATNRFPFDSTFSEALIWNVTKMIALYIAHEDVNGLTVSYLTGSKTGNLSYNSVGTKLNLLDFQMDGLKIKISTSLEYRQITKFENCGADVRDCKGGVAAGAQIDAKY